jgi:hypothetical protein
MAPMWKCKEAFGKILKIGKDGSVSVKWDGINGEWIFNAEQATKLEVIDVSK